jgi:signal transduction histidine kinase
VWFVPTTSSALALTTGLEDPDRIGWRRPPVGPDQLRTDALLAAAMLVGGLLSMVLWRVAGLYDEPAPAWLSVVCLVGVTAPLALRRRWPSAVLVVVAAVFVVLVQVLVPETLFANIALFAALYAVGAWEPSRRRATIVRAVVIAGMFLWLLIALFVGTSDPASMPDLSRAGAFSPLVAYLLIQLLTNVLYFAGAYWFGERAWASARERARTELRTVQLEQERRRVAAQAVALERLRLARELHDAVAHHVSMMGVQAAVARTLLAADPDKARGTLEQVEESAREAIEELHGILGTLREDAPDGPADEAVASLDVSRLPELVQAACDAGLPTTFQVVGEPGRLPPLTSLNLYRITQEALTNTRKHAGPSARADVRLRYTGDAVELEVADDGVGRATGTADTAGLGLVGIRERVAADGGTLVAGPRSRGGFLVRARIPLDRRGPDA